MHWRAETPEREKGIFWRLYNGDKNFSQLLKELRPVRGKRWARQTLTLYLKALVDTGCLRREERGRSVIYSLVRTHPHVVQMLGLDRVIISGSTELALLDENEFVTDWLNSVEFAFLNVIQGYLMLDQGETSEQEMNVLEPVNRFLESSISDLVDVAAFYGEHMADRIRLGKFNRKKIWEARDKLLAKIEEERRRMHGG